MVFLTTAIEAIFFARSLRSERLSRMIARAMGDSSVLPVRISILILLGFISLANKFGMEMVLGAYTAGMMIAMLTKVEILQYRLTSIGSGFLIPLFFITSGVEFDLPALVTSPASLARLVLFCAGFLFIRVLPVLLYKHVLPERELLPLALFSATTLPLVVAVTYLGVRTGDMLPENASALVGAAVISVTVFPNPRHFASVEIRRSPTRWRRGHRRPPRRRFGLGAVFSVHRLHFSENLRKAVTAPVCRRMKGSGPYRPSGFDIR
jgi:Kef-type K+ transport system membrane component KefB